MSVHRWKPDPENPVAAARCDASDFVVGRTDLVKQMEFHGLSLVWTGKWVSKRFADKPNPAMLTPILKADPAPIPNPRPQAEDNVIAQPWVYPTSGS